MPEPRQVGAPVNVYDTPIYYVPPPQEPVNIAAAFWHSFQAERSPWATQLFLARLRAMDPQARIQALLRARELENDRARQEMNALNVARQANASLYRTLLQTAAQVRGQDVQASIAGAEIASREKIAATSVESPLGQRFIADAGEAGKVLAEAMVRAGTASPDEKQAVAREVTDAARAMDNLIERATTETALSNIERGAVANQIRAQLRGQITPGQVQILTERGLLHFPAELPSEAHAAPGGPGFPGVVRELARTFGLEPEQIRPEDEARSVIVRGPARAIPAAEPAAEPAAVQLDEFGLPIGLPPELLEELAAPRGTRPPSIPGGAPVEDFVSRIGAEYEKAGRGIGAVGEPIFRRPDPRAAALEQAFAGAETSQETVDLLEALASTGRGKGPPGRQLEKALVERPAERIGREEALRAAAGAAVASGGAEQLAPTEEEDLEELTAVRQRQPAALMEDVRALAKPKRKQPEIGSFTVPEAKAQILDELYTRLEAGGTTTPEEAAEQEREVEALQFLMGTPTATIEEEEDEKERRRREARNAGAR